MTNHTSGGDGEPIAFAATSAARCVLEALRDRTKGAFTIVGNTGGGQFLQRDTVYSLGDGTAVLVRSDTQDDSFREYGPTRMVLKDAAAFEECLADPGLDGTGSAALWTCLTQAYDGTCYAGTPTCPK